MIETVTLDQLRAFVLVAEEGSFSAAGRRLSRVQSAVSQSINNLEASLDVQLFERNKKTPELTEAGRALLAQARQVLLEAGTLRAQARALHTGMEPSLTLAVDNLFPSQKLLTSLNMLREQFPDLPVTLFTAPLFAAERRLRGGAANIALCAIRPSEAPDLVASKLATIAMLPVAAPQHPLAMHSGKLPREMLARHVQLVLSDPAAAPDAPGIGVISSRIWRFVDLGWRLDFVRAGFGWCNMPAHLVSGPIAAGELSVLALEEPGLLPAAIPIYAVYARDRPPGKAGGWFLDDLMRAFGSEAGL